MIAINGFGGIVVSDTSNAVIQHCISSRNLTNFNFSVPFAGIWLQGSSSDVTVVQCTVENNRRGALPVDGILIDASVTSALIDSNQVFSNNSVASGFGIRINGTNQTNTVIRNNVYNHLGANYSITPSPLLLSYDISTLTLVGTPTTITPYHNLSTQF